jgi:hypothetical protein
VPAVQPGALGTIFNIGIGYQMVTFDKYPMSNPNQGR